MPKVLFLYPNMSGMMIPPAGVSSLASYLKSKGVIVDLFDTTLYKTSEKTSDERRVDVCQVRPFTLKDAGVEFKTSDMVQDFYNKVEEFKPDILAITANDFTIEIANKLIKGFKTRYPNIHVIMGGMYPTFFPNQALANPDVDSICSGEGYEALHELVVNLSEKKSILNIPNIHAKILRAIIHNPIRPPIDITKIPFDDFTIFEEKRLYRPMHGKIFKMIPIWLDLGCPYNCRYCVAPTLREIYKNHNYNYLRIKPVKQIIEELRYQVKTHKPDYIYFSTETFFARPQKHIKEFAHMYAKEFKIPFWAETRIETITDERVKLLKEMGCDRLSVGLESGDEKYRMNVLQKNFTNKQFFDAIKILQNNDLKITVNNIIGLPDETRDMIFETIYMNRKIVENNTCDISLTVSTFVPCGGSGFQKYCIEKGYLNLDEYLQKLPETFHGGFYLKNPNISEIELKGLYRTFPLYTRLPTNLFEDIKKAEKLTPEGDKIYNNLRELYWKYTK